MTSYRRTLPVLALALILAACAPATIDGEPTNACAAVLCAVGSTCEDGVCYPADATRCADPRPEICTLDYTPVCGSDGQTYGNGCGACANADVAWHVPGECASAPSDDGYVACEDPRPEACTKEYNPVCANVDNGIRCITTPCPSEDRKTYATGCTACADPKVYGYTPGACDPEVDNNPADDAPQAMPPVPGNGLAVRQLMVCKTADYDRTDFAQEFGYACVDACPSGYDQYGAQIGLLCIPHAGKTEIALWTQCVNGAQCLPEHRCAQSTHATGGGEITWASEAESFRCVPEYYATFLLHTGGLTAIDENGERTTAIA